MGLPPTFGKGQGQFTYVNICLHVIKNHNANNASTLSHFSISVKLAFGRA